MQFALKCLDLQMRLPVRFCICCHDKPYDACSSRTARLLQWVSRRCCTVSRPPRLRVLMRGWPCSWVVTQTPKSSLWSVSRWMIWFGFFFPLILSCIVKVLQAAGIFLNGTTGAIGGRLNPFFYPTVGVSVSTKPSVLSEKAKQSNSPLE